MISISICGARGKLGQRVAAFVDADKDLSFAGLIEYSGHPDISASMYGLNITSDIAEGIKDSDVVIDFSSTDTSVELAGICAKLSKKAVIGTTGLTPEQIQNISDAACDVPILLSPNMSIGVNLFFKMASVITDSLEGYEKEIIEAHHNKKVDSPSGTALKLAEAIKRDGEKLVFGREGKIGPRESSEIGVHAVRGGSIVGEHTVMWLSDTERIELTHKAVSRDVFASGAVKAAKWLAGCDEPRLYSMEDFLG